MKVGPLARRPAWSTSATARWAGQLRSERITGFFGAITRPGPALSESVHSGDNHQAFRQAFALDLSYYVVSQFYADMDRPHVLALDSPNDISVHSLRYIARSE